MNGFYEKISALTDKSNILTDEPMDRHTTFRIGGPADYFVSPENAEEAGKIILCCRENGIPYFITGNGSNLLVSDRGFRGVILQIGNHFQTCEREGNVLTAGAGILLSALAAFARDESLEGLAFASGIPGTLGGAVFMNAGAYGGEIRDVLTEATVLEEETGIVRTVPAEALCLGYRTSSVSANRWVVLGARLALREGSKEAISARMAELKEARNEKQPLNYPSAGSTFKRPEGYFAGKLIMDAGLAGYTVGGACVSEKHCGFVINKGNATARDVAGLIRHVRKTVLDESGVLLEPEVRFLGEFDIGLD